MRQIIDWLIGWPERVATHLTWLAPLFARITVGWVFQYLALFLWLAIAGAGAVSLDRLIVRPGARTVPATQ